MTPIFESDLSESDLDILRNGMRKYTEEHVPWETYEEVTYSIRDEDGKLQGAALGEAGRGWLKVELIWIAKPFRHQGYGSKLLTALEARAIEMGAKQAFLDTFSYQARPFYERHGYCVFGTLSDYPEGHCRFFMQKRLVA